MTTRPLNFHSEYVDQAFRLCSMFGATEAELAQFFGVTEWQVARWTRRYPEFRRAIWRGKAIADSAVAARLYEIALVDKDAAIHWLRNRCPEHWGKVADARHIDADFHQESTGVQ